MHACVRVWMSTCVCVCIYAYVCVYMRMCVCVYVRVTNLGELGRKACPWDDDGVAKDLVPERACLRLDNDEHRDKYAVGVERLPAKGATEKCNTSTPTLDHRNTQDATGIITSTPTLDSRNTQGAIATDLDRNDTTAGNAHAQRHCRHVPVRESSNMRDILFSPLCDKDNTHTHTFSSITM